jgi:hypothetical protein
MGQDHRTLVLKGRPGNGRPIFALRVTVMWYTARFYGDAMLIRGRFPGHLYQRPTSGN